MSEVSERYAVDELAAIAQLLGVPSFPGTNGALGPLHDDAREAALGSARRSLLARGVLEIDDAGILSVPAPHALLFRIALAPGLVVTVESRARQSVESRSYYVVPEAAVEHRVDVGRVHVLTRFDTGELLARVRQLVGLDGSSAAGEGSFATTPEELDEALRVAGDQKAPLPPEAASFSDSLSTDARVLRVNALHRDGKRLVGGELTWIDAGSLWLVDQTAEGVTVRGIAADALIEELLSYLPGEADEDI